MQLHDDDETVEEKEIAKKQEELDESLRIIYDKQIIWRQGKFKNNNYNNQTVFR